MIEQRFENFEDFYPFYLSQHLNITCRRLHFIGLISGLVTLAVVLGTTNWLYLPIPLLIGYGLAWIGHFFFEKNKPATFNYPLWSFLGDLLMLRDMLTGQIKL
jgi:hypothetical protein